MNVVEIPLAHVLPDTENPRSGDLEGIDELAQNIKAVGLLNPITVRLGQPDLEAGQETYVVVAGHRRLAAVTALAWPTVPCIVHDAEVPIEVALTENVMRQAMHPVDEHRAFVRLKTQGRSVKEIAKRFGIKELVVKQRLALGALLADWLEAWRAGAIDERCARHLAAAKPAQQKAIWDEWSQEVENPLERREPEDLEDLAEWIEDRVFDHRMSPDHPDIKPYLERYEAAGGKITTDLFGERKTLASPEIIARLKADERKAAEDEALAEGFRSVCWQGDPGQPGYDTHVRIYVAEALEREEKAAIDVVLTRTWDGSIVRAYYRDAPERVEEPAAAARQEVYAAHREATQIDPDLTAHVSRELAEVLTEACIRALKEDTTTDDGFRFQARLGAGHTRALILLAAHLRWHATHTMDRFIGSPLMIGSYGKPIDRLPEATTFPQLLAELERMSMEGVIRIIAEAVPAFVSLQDDRQRTWTSDKSVTPAVREEVVRILKPTIFAREIWKPTPVWFEKLKIAQLVEIAVECLDHQKPRLLNNHPYKGAWDYMKRRNWVNAGLKPAGRKEEWTVRVSKLAEETRWLPEVLRDPLYDGPGLKPKQDPRAFADRIAEQAPAVAALITEAQDAIEEVEIAVEVVGFGSQEAFDQAVKDWDDEHDDDDPLREELNVEAQIEHLTLEGAIPALTPDQVETVRLFMHKGCDAQEAVDLILARVRQKIGEPETTADGGVVHEDTARLDAIAAAAPEAMPDLPACLDRRSKAKTGGTSGRMKRRSKGRAA